MKTLLMGIGIYFSTLLLGCQATARTEVLGRDVPDRYIDQRFGRFCNTSDQASPAHATYTSNVRKLQSNYELCVDAAVPGVFELLPQIGRQRGIV